MVEACNLGRTDSSLSRLRPIKVIWFPLHSDWLLLDMRNKLIQSERSPRFLSKVSQGREALLSCKYLVCKYDAWGSCFHLATMSGIHLRRCQPKRTTNLRKSQKNRIQNFNQSLIVSGFFYYPSVKYTLYKPCRVLCTVEGTLVVLPYWLPRVFVTATCLVVSAIPK